MFTKVLYATDGSPSAEAALYYAIDVARTYAAEVIVLNCYDPVPAFMGTFSYHKQLEPRLTEGECLLHRVITMFNDQGVEAHHELTQGPASEVIVKMAQEEGCDLIIMGAHGSGEQHEGLGSTSQQVLHNAHCPVLVIR